MLRVKPLYQTEQRQRPQDAENQVVMERILLLRVLKVHHVPFWRRQERRHAISYRISHEETQAAVSLGKREPEEPRTLD